MEADLECECKEDEDDEIRSEYREKENGRFSCVAHHSVRRVGKPSCFPKRGVGCEGGCGCRVERVRSELIRPMSAEGKTQGNKYAVMVPRLNTVLVAYFFLRVFCFRVFFWCFVDQPGG